MHLLRQVIVKLTDLSYICIDTSDDEKPAAALSICRIWWWSRVGRSHLPGCANVVCLRDKRHGDGDDRDDKVISDGTHHCPKISWSRHRVIGS